jgi:hypothetical protein
MNTVKNSVGCTGADPHFVCGDGRKERSVYLALQPTALVCEYRGAVLTAMMPSGVEHSPRMIGSGCSSKMSVLTAMMPSGVEHARLRPHRFTQFTRADRDDAFGR